MANRYAVQRHDGFTVVQFGLVDKAGFLLSRIMCVFPEQALLSLKENLVRYSDDLGEQKAEIPVWTPPVHKAETELLPVIDFVHLSHGEDHAEICFWNYSHGHLADLVKAEKAEQIMPWGVAMVRCVVDLQRAFLLNLYED